MEQAYTGILGSTDDSAKNKSRSYMPVHDPPPAEDSVWNRFTRVFGEVTIATAEHQEQQKSHERTRIYIYS